MHFKIPHQIKIRGHPHPQRTLFPYISDQRPIWCQNCLEHVGKAKHLPSPFSAWKLKHPSFYCQILGEQKCENTVYIIQIQEACHIEFVNAMQS